MLQSMTGFGVARGKVGKKRILIEAKSVNHKFCEVNLRIPPRYSILEGKITQFAKTIFSRGRIDIFLKEEAQGSPESIAKINLDKLSHYYRSLQRVQKTLHLKEEIHLDTLLSLPQVISVSEEEDLEKTWPALKKLFQSTFVALNNMRKKEGKSVTHFLIDQLKEFSSNIEKIKKLIPINLKNYQKQFQERVQKLAPGIELDPQRLTQEVAYFVDRTDVSEEIQRVQHHIKHFANIVKGDGPHGRKLEFLLQEMNRETNTLSAKSQSSEVSQIAVECKHLLEKIREQLQNVE
jgi:uncharacterized protein (TIGR00255 family)